MAPLAARSAVPDQHFHDSLPSPGIVRGLVRKDAARNPRIRPHSWTCAEKRTPTSCQRSEISGQGVSVAVHMVRPEDLVLVRMITRRAIEAV